MKETIETEILKVLDAWMETFNRLDMIAWENTFHFRIIVSLLAGCKSLTNRVSRMWRG